MDIRDIKHFITIIEEGNINAAAKHLHLSQPPLSRQMKQLEEELGVKLFERGNRKVKLTEAGRLLQSRGGRVLGLMDNTIKEMRELDGGIQGTLSIGTVISSGTTFLPEVVRVFRNQFPGVRFQVWEGETSRITELLNRGTIEIGMVRYPFDSELYESIKLPNEPLVAAINQTQKDYLGNHPNCINLSELAGKPLMIHRKYESTIIDHCEQSGFKPDIICMSDDVMLILAWADADIGIAIVPRAAVGLIPSTNLTFKTIINPCLETTAAVIWIRNRYLSVAARNFLTLFTKIHINTTLNP